MKGNGIFSCGEIVCSYFSNSASSEFIEGDRCNDKYEIIYILSASGNCNVEGVDYSLKSGSLLLINPFSYNRFVLQGESYEIYSLQFQKSSIPEEARTIFEKIVDDGEDNGRFYLEASSKNAIANVFQNFRLGEDFLDASRRVYFEALLTEIIVFLSALDGEKIINTDNTLGARVMRYLNNNIEKNISLDKLARRFFVSKYHLCRAFKEHSGISVHSYINHKRIMYARRLIENGTTASKAAEKVGFGDYSAFYRAYIRIVGKTPTADSK
ncbi:MAG: helix-turn-helix domain-containing protein [Clostridia bacterium]|nr:helix-turn-helix domain-containing protein [Clostridia bacterium]